MDGLEVARGIQALQLSKPPQLIMITAYGREDVLAQADAVGIAMVLIKPVNASLLFDSIMRVFGFADSPQAAGPQEALSHDLGPIAGARILLVEDNDLNQQVAQEMLASAGLRVDLAENGLEAVEKVQAGNYDLVLMDMQMPVMDGVCATIEIRKRGFTEVPILAMTANAFQDDRDKCLAAGMNAHLAKPIDPDALYEALLAWVKPGRRDVFLPPPRVDDTGEGPTLPHGIAGLDVAVGLQHCGNKKHIYKELLAKFATGQCAALDAILAALDAGDKATAERRAHTLKGTARTIGALAVGELAQRLEAAIHDDEPRSLVDTVVNDTASPLTRLVAGLEDYLSRQETADVQATEGLELGCVREVCERLKSLLESSDSEAEDVVDNQGALLQKAFPSKYPPIAQAVKDFDYDNALSLLVAAVSSLPDTQGCGEGDGRASS